MGTRLVELGLQAKAISEVVDAAGVDITCRCGSVWITLDGDPRDIVLDAGEHFRTNERRRALIYALEPSRLVLTDCEAPRFAAPHPEPRAMWAAAQSALA